MISNHASVWELHLFSVCQAMHLSCLCLLHVTIKKHNANLLRVTSAYSSHWIPSTSCQISNWMIPPALNRSVLTLCWHVHTSSRGIIKVSSLIGRIGRAWSCAALVLPCLPKGRSLFCRRWVRHKVCEWFTPKALPCSLSFCDLHQQGTPHPSLEFMMEHSPN